MAVHPIRANAMARTARDMGRAYTTSVSGSFDAETLRPASNCSRQLASRLASGGDSTMLGPVKRQDAPVRTPGAAARARKNAYAPYSRFPVGAAVLAGVKRVVPTSRAAVVDVRPRGLRIGVHVTVQHVGPPPVSQNRAAMRS